MTVKRRLSRRKKKGWIVNIFRPVFLQEYVMDLVTAWVGFGALMILAMVIGVWLEIHMRIHHPEAHAKLQQDMQKMTEKVREDLAARKAEREKKHGETTNAVADIFVNMLKKKTS